MIASTPLVSLWDMLKDYAFLYGSWISDLAQWRKKMLRILKDEGKEARIGDEGNHLARFIQGLRVPCRDLGLDATLAQIGRVEKFGYANATVREMLRECDELRRRLVDQLRGHKFYYVPLSKAGYYDEPLGFVGATVTERFSVDAVWHFEEAGKCLALGRASASVYHLSAAIEEGLKGLARFLGIEYMPNWDGYIRAVRKRLDTPWKDRPEDWRRDEGSYRELLEDLEALKLSIRNPSAHGEKYTEEQALRIHSNISAFAKHMARLLPPAAPSQ